MRTNVELDDALVEEAFRLTRVRTKRELMDLALRELVRIRRKRNLAELAGRVQLAADYDHKAAREARGGDR